jgi:hypothetical protein
MRTALLNEKTLSISRIFIQLVSRARMNNTSSLPRIITITKHLAARRQDRWLGFSFVLPLFIVRLLSQQEVGHYREAFQVITKCGRILPLGFSMSAYYFLSRETDGGRRLPCIQLFCCSICVGGRGVPGMVPVPQSIGNLFLKPGINAPCSQDRLVI